MVCGCWCFVVPLIDLLIDSSHSWFALARENIRVNALCPGPLKTELLMKYLDTEEKKQRRLVHIPMGRFGLAEEIAKGALFLASDEVCVCVCGCLFSF
jgi:NAD(P)-dependent dehydrogenase (short-subunit alcohol dehydrogenase family)